jgi:hypothetical protein
MRKLNGTIVRDISRRARAKAVLIGTDVAMLAVIFASCANPGPATERRTATHDDSPIGRAFASGTSDIQVEGEGTVISVLPDDADGSRHQRFIVQLASGQTLLITHNIEVAPRIGGLKVGDSVGFNGEYVWMKKAASSIGRTMIHRVGMSQVGLCMMARDISNDSILDSNICNVGVIARACSLNRKFQEIVAGRGVVSYTHSCQITYTK